MLMFLNILVTRNENRKKSLFWQVTKSFITLFFFSLRWLDEGLRLICLRVSTSATFSTANSNSITAKSIAVNTGNPTQLRTQTSSRNRSIKGTEL